jgi:hypothetical protein
LLFSNPAYAQVPPPVQAVGSDVITVESGPFDVSIPGGA